MAGPGFKPRASIDLTTTQNSLSHLSSIQAQKQRNPSSNPRGRDRYQETSKADSTGKKWGATEVWRLIQLQLSVRLRYQDKPKDTGQIRNQQPSQMPFKYSPWGSLVSLAQRPTWVEQEAWLTSKQMPICLICTLRISRLISSAG